jgi:Flp pilus assembly protein TadG
MSKIAIYLRHLLVQFRTAKDAVSAMEFGLILPLLTTIVITVADVANIAVGVGAMQTAVRQGIQYAMNGGTDPTVAQTQALQAWSNEPSGGTLTATQACTCLGSSAGCQATCIDGSTPEMFITVTATATLGGNVIKKTETTTQSVRVR